MATEKNQRVLANKAAWKKMSLPFYKLRSILGYD